MSGPRVLASATRVTPLDHDGNPSGPSMPLDGVTIKADLSGMTRAFNDAGVALRRFGDSVTLAMRLTEQGRRLLFPGYTPPATTWRPLRRRRGTRRVQGRGR